MYQKTILKISKFEKFKFIIIFIYMLNGASLGTTEKQLKF